MSPDAFTEAIHDLKGSVDRGGVRFRRLLYAILILGVVVLILLAITSWLTFRMADVLSGSKAARSSLITVTDKLADCTTPGPNPPPKTGHDCYDQSNEKLAAGITAVTDTNSDGVPDVKQLAEAVGHPLPPPTSSVPKL